MTVTDLTGHIVADKYRVVRRLGSGGMGVVYLASNVDADFPVAIKLLHGEQADRKTRRFLREARIAAQIRHPNVVRVLDFGRWGSNRDRYYMTMEYIEGVTMSALLDGVLPIGGIIDLVSQMLEALAYVHSRGVLHRDIKPENVMVMREPGGELVARVTDFGVAAALHDDDARITVDGATVGTPGYMAPEQALGSSLDGPTLDLYSVGTLLYRALTGRLPFDGNVTTVLVEKATREAVWPDDPTVDVPPDLVAIIMKLLARRPEHRFAVAADVLGALKPFALPARLSTSEWRRLGGRSAESAEIALAQTTGPEDLRATVRLREAVSATQSDASRQLMVARSRLWGRVPEVSLISERALHAEIGEACAVVLQGEAGIGKSAIMLECAALLAEAGRFFPVEVRYHDMASAHGGPRLTLDSMLGTVGRSASTVRAAAEEFLARYDDADPGEIDAIVRFLRPATAPGSELDDPGQSNALLMRMLRRLGRDRPVVLTVDDLHLGGSESAALMEYVLFEISYEPFPLLVLATMRERGLDPRFRNILGRTDRFEGGVRHTVALGPIDADDMTDGLMKTHGLSRMFATRVARRSGGNPLFATHLAAAGSQERTSESNPSLSTSQSGTLSNPDSGEIPHALRTILLASLEDQLQAAPDVARARNLTTQLALLGQLAEVELLELMCDEDPNFDDDLDTLLENGVLVENVEGVDERISFAQSLTRDAILSSLSSRKLRRFHKRAAEIREEWAGEDGSRHWGPIGDHWYAAGDADRAIDWWLRAKRVEVCSGDALRAAHWGLKAFHELHTDDRRRPQLAIGLGRLLANAGELAEARAVLEPLVDHPDPDTALVVMEVLAEVFENIGLGTEWSDLIDRMRELMPRAGLIGQRAYHRAAAFMLNSLGRPHDARSHAEASVDGAGPGYERQRGYQRLAIILTLTGEVEAAEEAARRSIEAAGDIPGLRVRSLRSLGVLYCWSGRLDEARTVHEEAIDLARRSGNAARVALSLGDLGDVFLTQGNVVEARKFFERSHRAATALDIGWTRRFSKMLLIVCDLILGSLDGLEDEIDVLMRDSGVANHRLLMLSVLPLRVWYQIANGDLDTALEGIEELSALWNFPRFRVAGEFGEGIGKALVDAVDAGRTDLIAQAETFLEFGQTVWQNLGNRKRAADCAQLLTYLRALEPAPV